MLEQQEEFEDGNAVRHDRSILRRWGGHECLMGEGYVPVIGTFLRYASRLAPGLSPAESMFVIHLMKYKWDAKAPFPGYKSVAKDMGISVKYARKLASTLEAKGLLRREMRIGTTNRFDLQPLFDKLAAQVSQRDDTRGAAIAA